MAYLIANKAIILPFVLFVLSEAMSLNPKWKSNGVLQLIYNFLKLLSGK